MICYNYHECLKHSWLYKVGIKKKTCTKRDSSHKYLLINFKKIKKHMSYSMTGKLKINV